MIGCKPLTDVEVAALCKHLSIRDLTLFKLGLSTGFRITELLSIKIADLYEYNGSLKTQLLVTRKNMKGKKRSRGVPLGATVQGILLQYLPTLPAGQVFLFQSNRGQLSRYQAWRAIKSAAVKAGLTGKIATHSMRKTIANKAYTSSGKDLVLTQKLLGHSNIQSTISYLNIQPEQLSSVWDAVQGGDMSKD